MTMGEWTIVIQGHGIHDNGRTDDADAICQRFVDELAGSQEIQAVHFTVGARRALGVPVPGMVVTGGHPARRVPG
jgi:hypothetical protein